MLKQAILIAILSITAIFFRTEISHILNALVYAHNFIARMLHYIFSDDTIGRLIQNLLALLALPFLCGLLVALVFWLVKRATMPHIMAVVWVLWLILLVTMIVQTGVSRHGIVDKLSSRHHNVIRMA